MGKTDCIDFDEPLVGRRIVTGRVVEVQTQSVFQSGFVKAAGVLFERRPWQFGHQIQKTTIFVEPLASFGGACTPQRALVFNGDINAAVAKGNVIQAAVAKRGGMLYVRRLVNLTTSSQVTPTVQLSPGLALLLGGGAIAALIAVFALIIDCFATGRFAAGFAALANGLLEGLAPVIVIGIFAYVFTIGLRK